MKRVSTLLICKSQFSDGSSSSQTHISVLWKQESLENSVIFHWLIIFIIIYLLYLTYRLVHFCALPWKAPSTVNFFQVSQSVTIIESPDGNQTLHVLYVWTNPFRLCGQTPLKTVMMLCCGVWTFSLCRCPVTHRLAWKRKELQSALSSLLKKIIIIICGAHRCRAHSATYWHQQVTPVWPSLLNQPHVLEQTGRWAGVVRHCLQFFNFT